MDKIQMVLGWHFSYNRGIFATKRWIMYTSKDILYGYSIHQSNSYAIL